MKKFKKFKEYDEAYDERPNRYRKLNEKKILSALRQRDATRLIDIKDDYT